MAADKRRGSPALRDLVGADSAYALGLVGRARRDHLQKMP